MAIPVSTFALDSSDVRLPAGNVRTMESDRVLSIGGWVVAVGISSTVYMAARPRPQPIFPSPLLEQLVGFLVGRGADVLRMDIRFPLVWHKSGSLEATAKFWAEQFLVFSRERRLFLCLPPRLDPPIVLPVAPAARTAIEFWEEALLLAQALSSEFPNSLMRLRPEFWRVAKDWELQWNITLRCASDCSAISPDEWQLVHSADRGWANLVRHYLEPHGYLMTPDSTARLL